MQAARMIITVNNFIGWCLTITIIGSPLGLPMLAIGYALKCLIDIRSEVMSQTILLRDQ
jgi:hypothetical protein